jgi:hypothetical protein
MVEETPIPGAVDPRTVEKQGRDQLGLVHVFQKYEKWNELNGELAALGDGLEISSTTPSSSGFPFKKVDAVGQRTFVAPDRVPEGVDAKYRADLVGFRHAGSFGALGSGLGCNKNAVQYMQYCTVLFFFS